MGELRFWSDVVVFRLLFLVLSTLLSSLLLYSYPLTPTHPPAEVPCAGRDRVSSLLRCVGVGGLLGMNRWAVRREWCRGQERERETLQLSMYVSVYLCVYIDVVNTCVG